MGRSGLKLSVLSFGSWVNFDPTYGLDRAVECLAAAYDGGVNFFDCAENYSMGESEKILGAALAQLGWPRRSYVVSTKFFFGLHHEVNSWHTLNRKYLLQALDGSLERLGLDFVDLAFCHRPDPETPIDEVVWAMSDLIAAGKALYWGVSEWPADDIRAAVEIAERHHLRAPVVEQPQYNLIARRRVEVDYARLYDDVGLGLTTWSPLASGVLTGKYLDGIPEGSRLSVRTDRRTTGRAADRALAEKITALAPIAAELDCTRAQLALAWCVANPHVSSVITGASRISQIDENLRALDVVELLDAEVLARIDEIFPK